MTAQGVSAVKNAGRLFKDRIYEQLARIGKAVSSPQRLEILDLLSQGERTVESLAQEAHLSTANTSRHLQVLRAARLVEAEKEGVFIRYRIADDAVSDFFRTLRLLAATRLAELAEMARRFFEGCETMELVDRKALLKRVRRGELLVLDVRPSEEYRAGHIPGAVSIPLKNLRQRLSELPRDQDIAAYCRGPYCVLAAQAVELLREHGLRAVRLEDSGQGWRAQGLPLDVGERATQ